MTHRLEASALVKRYGELDVLGGITLHLDHREALGILGPSGCGKTTLLRILLGVESPDSGAVSSPLSQAGYLPQDGMLFPWKTVGRNAELPLIFQRMPRRARRRKVTEMLPLFGLESFGDAYPHEISGGMRQRASLLRAVLTASDVLVLDEPFGALDIVTRERLQDWLSSITAELGSTLLFVTHDPNEITALSSRAIALSARPARLLGEEPIDLIPAERRDRLGRAFLTARDRILERIRAGGHDGS